jgi:carbon dioxide concentrating mechanism protein CcmL
MVLGKVVGTVVSSTQSTGIEGSRFLLVDKCSQKGERKGDYVVALDLIGAGYDEMILLSEGSPARETPATINRPLDALIVGIVDLVEENNTIVYKK